MIEQLRRLEERRHVDGFPPRHEGLEIRERGREGGLGQGIAAEDEAGRDRDADAKSRRYGAARPSPIRRENGSDGAKPAMAEAASNASSTVSAKTETQSSDRQAGTTPCVGTAPSVGFNPTMLLSPAGTRPDPAVSANGKRVKTLTIDSMAAGRC